MEFLESGVANMPELHDLTIENNPIEATSNDISKILSGKLQSLTHQTIHKIQASIKEVELSTTQVVAEAEAAKVEPTESKIKVLEKETGSTTIELVNNAHIAARTGQTAAKKKAQENAVIKIIQKEWEREMERLDFKKNG